MIKTKSKRKQFNIVRGRKEIEHMIDGLPGDDEVYKFVSTGGFSSICFISYIANITKINELHVSTLRVGKKELQMLDVLRKAGKLGKCNFVIGSLMANDSKAINAYGYYSNFRGVCEKNGWSYVSAHNHSKILLFDTDVGKFVIETSSNLNENPKFEQFSFERSDELYEFYLGFFDDIKKSAAPPNYGGDTP